MDLSGVLQFDFIVIDISFELLEYGAIKKNNIKESFVFS